MLLAFPKRICKPNHSWVNKDVLNLFLGHKERIENQFAHLDLFGTNWTVAIFLDRTHLDPFGPISGDAVYKVGLQRHFLKVLENLAEARVGIERGSFTVPTATHSSSGTRIC